jgi:CBS-domain-containing membrane protein
MGIFGVRLRDEEFMRVSELMETDVQGVSVETPVSDVFVTLADSRVSALPVLDGAGRLVGVISRTDILAAEEEAEGEAARETRFQDTLARDLMTSPALTIGPDATVRDAAQQMLSAGVHRLFVTNQQQPLGVISVTDIVRAVAASRL